jgi:hypothetical protein
LITKEAFTSARRQLREKVRRVTSEDFEALALDIFRFQAEYNLLYRRYLELLGRDPRATRSLRQIPFFPINLFKTHSVQTGSWTARTIFTSSATTGATPSKHLVRDLDWYHDNARRAFAAFYGDPVDFCILALLPAYLEREGSSLVAMADDFIRRSRYVQSGFFLNDVDSLLSRIEYCQANHIPTLLLGVSFALLDLAETRPAPLGDIIVMETGGMKGRRREITREELHGALRAAFQVETIHSEYGMTELFSQAYASAAGLFRPGPAMRVLPRDITDPLCGESRGRTAAINIIDLANIDTISFIATDDLGRVYEDGAFEILGRLDNSDIRGCNLMVGDAV